MTTTPYHFFVEIDVLTRGRAVGKDRGRRLWVIARTEIDVVDDMTVAGRFDVICRFNGYGPVTPDRPIPTEATVYRGHQGRTYVPQGVGPMSLADANCRPGPRIYADLMGLGLKIGDVRHTVTGKYADAYSGTVGAFEELSPAEYVLDIARRRVEKLADRVRRRVVSYRGQPHLAAPLPVWTALPDHRGAYLTRVGAQNRDARYPLRSFGPDLRDVAIGFSGAIPGAVSGAVHELDPAYLETRHDLLELAIFAGENVSERLRDTFQMLPGYMVRWWHEARNIREDAFDYPIDAPATLSQIAALSLEAERLKIGAHLCFDADAIEMLNRRLAVENIEPARIGYLPDLAASGPTP